MSPYSQNNVFLGAPSALALGCPFLRYHLRAGQGITAGLELGLAFSHLALPSHLSAQTAVSQACVSVGPCLGLQTFAAKGRRAHSGASSHTQAASHLRSPLFSSAITLPSQDNELLHLSWNGDLCPLPLKEKHTQTHKTSQSHHTMQANWAFKKKSLPTSCLQAEQIITLPQGRKVLIKAIH